MWALFKKIMIVIALIASVAASIAYAADDFRSIKEFGDWVTFYYQNPKPEKVSGALEYFTSSPLYGTDATITTAAFFCALFQKNSSLMRSTFDELSSHGSENAKIMLINILSFINNSESKILLEKAKNFWRAEQLQDVITHQMSSPHKDLYNRTIDSSQILDMLWASFFATGDDWPVKRIISVLHLAKDGHGMEIMLGRDANWSLDSNSKQHRKVCQICQEELKRQTDITKEMLGRIALECG